MRGLRKTMLVCVFLMATVSFTLFAGGKSEQAVSKTGKSYRLNVSGIMGSLHYLPVYVAREKGWFSEEGFTFEEVLFTNGPVQMESLASNAWDIGITGVGGVMSGVIGYEAVLLGAVITDDGTQYVFARNDSPVVKAGAGNNSLDPRIYGDANSWKGKRILCNTGTVLQYLLVKTLGGFNLKSSDVQFIAMDVPTAYSSFLAGQGDLAVLTGSAGSIQMMNDKNYTAVSSATWAKTGLMGNILANKNSLADPAKREAMKVFLKVYYKSLTWIDNNFEEAVDYLINFVDESGYTLERSVASQFLKADTYYSLKEAADMMNAKAPGKNYSVMEDRLLGVLNFFIGNGSYKQGDDVKFLGKMDASLLNEVLNESK
jgi:ABC-type nitrate/sulfonate/bicarbonate transport system substrate-binding protein